MTGTSPAARSDRVTDQAIGRVCLVVLVCELLPLCMYFSVLYRIGKNGLSQTAIDSVYYFGFIVTILSLAGSVMHEKKYTTRSRASCVHAVRAVQHALRAMRR